MSDVSKWIGLNSQRGVGFILVLMIAAAVSLFAVPLVIIGSSSLLASKHADQELQERYAADAGVEAALWHIKHDPDYQESTFDTGSLDLTFNKLPTNVTITKVTPPQSTKPDPQTFEGDSHKMAGYKTVGPINWVEPCVADSICDTYEFDYTLSIENYGTNPINLNALGDCLPEGFSFMGVKDVVFFDGIPFETGGFTNDDWKTEPDGTPVDITAADLLPDNWVEGTVPVLGVEVGRGNEWIDGVKPPTGYPKVKLTVINDGSDLFHPCPPGRTLVKWDFPPPITDVSGATANPTIANIVLTASSDSLTFGTYYNEMWWDASPNTNQLGGKFTCGTSPVFAQWPAWDIRSEAGGSAAEARAFVRKDLDNDPIVVHSWQIGGAGAGAGGLGNNALHIANMCGRGIPTTSGNQWQAEVVIVLHDGGNPIPGADVTGTWREGENILATTSCVGVTDGTGRCVLESGKLDLTDPPSQVEFAIDNIYLLGEEVFNYNRGTVVVNQPGYWTP